MSEPYVIDHLSFSKLSLFSRDVNLFRSKYVTKTMKHKESKSLDLGSVVDVMILTPKEFENRFVIGKEPVVAGKMGVFIESYAKSKAMVDKLMVESNLPIDEIRDDYDLMRDAYKEAEYSQSFDTTIDCFKKEPKNQDYYKFLYDKYLRDSHKSYISEEMYATAIHMAKAIDFNKFTESWRRSPGETQLEVLWRNEICPDVPFLSFIDKVSYNDADKIIYIDDLKTTDKPLVNFHESIEEYRYDWQAALYRKAVQYLISKGTYPNYKTVNRIIGVETFSPYRSVIVEFTERSIFNADLEINKHLENLLWHIKSNIWDFPKYIYDNNGIMKY